MLNGNKPILQMAITDRGKTEIAITQTTITQIAVHNSKYQYDARPNRTNSFHEKKLFNRDVAWNYGMKMSLSVYKHCENERNVYL